MADNKKSSIKKGSSVYLLNVKQPDRASKRLKLGFRSVPASLFFSKTNRTLEGTVGLLDMSETGAGIYTPELLSKGAPVQLVLTEPYPLRVNGMVIWSMPVASSVHNARFRFRAGIKFLFATEMDQSLVKEFLEKILVDPVDALQKSLNAPPVVMPPMPATSPEAAVPAAPAAPVEAAAAAPAPVDPAAPAANSEPAVAAAPAPGTEAAAPAAEAPVAPAAEATTPLPASGDGSTGGTPGEGGSQAA